MSHQTLPKGLYLATQPTVFGFQHFGIIDVGNKLGLPEVSYFSPPVVIHQTQPQIRCDWLPNTPPWYVEGKIVDELGAIYRIREAANNPVYNLVNNNCEHFANYVVNGQPESRQVQTVIVTASIVSAAVILLRE